MNPAIRTYTFPVAFLLGGIFYLFFTSISFLTPYLLGTMLYITFSRISIQEMRFKPLHFKLLAFQLLVGVVLYFALYKIDNVLAQGAMICVFAPAAMASATVGGLLGANVATMTSFVLLSNISVAFLAPFWFSAIGAQGDLPFWGSIWSILWRVVPLIVFPLIASWLTEKLLPKVHTFFMNKQSWSFYLWALVLTIIMGETVSFVISQPKENYTIVVILAVVALIICLIQFGVGRAIGKRGGEVIAGGQSLGQKNMALAVWLTLSFLNPLASIAPAAYVVWQNVINSIQLARKKE